MRQLDFDESRKNKYLSNRPEVRKAKRAESFALQKSKYWPNADIERFLDRLEEERRHWRY